MKTKSVLALLLLLSSLAMFTVGALAKHNAASENENMAVFFGESAQKYAIYGTGGIRVKSGHHGILSSNTTASTIEIDGSGITSQRYQPSYVQADFNAVANSAFFVSNSCLCTLPSAAGVAGQEIVVCSTAKNATITYQTANSEALSGSDQSGKLVNATFGKVDRFISDGRTWYRE